MKLLLFLIPFGILTTTFSLASVEFLKPWERSSSPNIMGRTFIKTFSSLPLVGQAIGKEKYWSSDYWPLNKGNINYRWNSPVPQGFNLESPDYDEVVRMTEEELATLSPSEKYDLFTGNYDYPLKERVDRRASPRDRDWEGICHGWAAATLNHNEPKPKIVLNPDGLRIPFGSSDIKALLSYFYAYHHDPVTTHQMGKRCNGRRHCTDDMNAGAFHIALANKLGLEGKSFIADIENGREVWNQVLYSYRSEIIHNDLPPASDSSKGTAKVIRLKTIVRVVFNIVKNSWLPVRGTNLQTYRDEVYEYDLDISKSGNIIGGDWRTKTRPDFLWLVAPATKFRGTFSRLPELLDD